MHVILLFKDPTTFGRLTTICAIFCALSWDTPFSCLHPLGHELGVVVLIFGVSKSWSFFHVKYLSQKSYEKLYPGGPQSETVRFEKNPFVTLNCNISWFLNDRNKIFLLLKIEVGHRIFSVRLFSKNKEYNLSFSVLSFSTIN